MKKSSHLFLNQVKQVSLFVLLIFFYSITAKGQFSAQHFAQNQFDPKTHYPLIFLSPQTAGLSQQNEGLQWETIQSVVIAQKDPNSSLPPVKLNLDQVRNGSGTSPVVPPTVAPWVNGNAGASNAHFAEGWSIPYRCVIENLPLGAHSVDIEWDARQSSSSAIDFVTNYDLVDYPAGSHVNSFGHVQEVLNPLTEAGTWISGTSVTIPVPTFPGGAPGPVAGYYTAIMAYSNASGPANKFSVWNANITGMSYVSEGNVTVAASSTKLRINFTNTGSTVVISWGGHIAKGPGVWGDGNSAAAVSGSPYHTRLISWDPDGDGEDQTSIGNQDRSLSADAVQDPPVCDLAGPTSMQCSSVSTFTSDVNSSDLGAGNTFEWSIVNGSGCNASIVDGTHVDYATVNSGTGCGCTFTVRYRLLKTGTELSQCNLAVSTTDNTAPTLTCGAAPASPIDCGVTPSFASPTASDNCTPTTAIAITSSDVSTTSCGQARTVTRTWKATDACGNTSTCSRSVVVRDITPPVFSGVGGPSTIDCPATPVFSSPSASDACGTGTFTPTFSDNSVASCGNARTVTRTWVATDACGNTATASQAITVRDNVGPVISGVGGPSTIDCPAEPSFSSPTASDACSNSTASISFSDAPTNSCGAARSVTRKWTATDACGNTSTASQTITVRDNTPPAITCPPNVVVECTVDLATADLGTATATDACGASSVSSSDGPPVVRGCVSVITRKWIARDACGNTSSCVQIITKRDNTGPVINCTLGTATDNCSPAGDITIYFNNGIWTAIDGSGNVTTATADCSVQGAGRMSTSQVIEETKEQQVVIEEKTAAPIARKELVNNITVQAIPNPFNDRVKFVVTSPETGYGSLEVMNMLGQKVKTVYQGQMNAGTQSFEMSLPGGRYSTLFYILRMNGKQVTGKLVQRN